MADNNAKISLGKGYNGGLQVTLYADSAAELTGLVGQLFGEVAGGQLLNAVLHDFALQAGPEVAALDAANRGLGPVTNVQQPPFTPDPPVSTVGQPLPQQQVQQPQAAANPPGLAYPGNCAHGARNYVAGKGRGGTPWNRWECALPWKAGRDEATKAYNSQRCEAINV